MEPTPLGAPEWSELGSMLFALWMVVIFIVLFAANMLVGHNMLPSFIASRHVPESLQKARTVLLRLRDNLLRDRDVFPCQHNPAGRRAGALLARLLDIGEHRWMGHFSSPSQPSPIKGEGAKNR